LEIIVRASDIDTIADAAATTFKRIKALNNDLHKAKTRAAKDAVLAAQIALKKAWWDEVKHLFTRTDGLHSLGLKNTVDDRKDAIIRACGY
jgi:hypothetical protein